MLRTPVISNNITSIGHEPGKMHIEFRNGNVYEYTGPKVDEHHAALMKAQSKGRHFTDHIRHCKQTTCVKLGADPQKAAPPKK